MKIWQYNTVPVDAARQYCIDQVKINRPADVEYELLSEYCGLLNSNTIRYKLLSENPYDVWFDTDILIKSWWTPPDDGFIYCDFASSMIFPNGNGSVFTQLLDFYIKSGIKHTILLSYLTDNSIPFKFIPEVDNYFFHLALNFSSTCCGSSLVSNQRCTVMKEGGTDLKLVWIKDIGIIK